MREIATHPADYPEAAAILPQILAEIGRDQPVGGPADIEPQADGPSIRPPPEVVLYADLAPDGGVKSFIAKDGKSYMFVGDDTPSEMAGGNAINWFMPGSDYDLSLIHILALDGNPEIQAQRHLVQASRQRYEAARAGHLPTARLYARKQLTNSNGENQIGQHYDTGSIGIEVSIPLYSGGRTSAASGQMCIRDRLSVFQHDDAAAWKRGESEEQ